MSGRRKLRVALPTDDTMAGGHQRLCVLSFSRQGRWLASWWTQPGPYGYEDFDPR